VGATKGADQYRRFRPRARIMRALGDELISSEVVALIELVKNSYDADATRVLLRFKEPLEPGKGSIDVIDDGHGMTVETVDSAWLEPATPYRRRSIRSEEFGRPVLGEKGIGRFAVSRLADELELVTRRPGAPEETHGLFDWRLFDDDDAYLDEIAVVVEVRTPVDITAGGAVEALWIQAQKVDAARKERGTLLRMSTLRRRWEEVHLRNLQRGLSRLVSPFLFDQQRARSDGFSILLNVPDRFAGLSGPVEPPEALRNPSYTLKGRVESDGRFRVTMSVHGTKKPVTRSGTLIAGRQPSCGPFDIELRVWDRDRTSMSELAERTKATAREVGQDLDAAAGVSIYRDGFRILPYGEPGNDWLQLDARRVQNPTLRLSNNQIVGYLSISREANPELRDQSNREGLFQNQAFVDLRDAVRSLIGELEQARYAVRPREERARPKDGGLFAGFDLAGVRAYANDHYPGDLGLAQMLGEAQATLDEGVQRVEEVVARYRRLATLGELIDKVLHDGRAPLAKIGGEAELALRDIGRKDEPSEELISRLRKRLNLIGKQQDVLATVFRRIEPFGGRRRGRPRPLALEQVIADSFAVLEGDLKRNGIAVELPESTTTVTVDAAELQEVFVNLIDNSVHWLQAVPRDKRRIRVAVNRDDDGLHIMFADSGPGVREDIRDKIFDPYFSTKEHGVGLGLSIAGELVEEYYGGRLELLDTGPLPGANFRVTLRRRV
jgi:signal transduction histidine kinase